MLYDEDFQGTRRWLKCESQLLFKTIGSISSISLPNGRYAAPPPARHSDERREPARRDPRRDAR